MKRDELLATLIQSAKKILGKIVYISDFDEVCEKERETQVNVNTVFWQPFSPLDSVRLNFFVICTDTSSPTVASCSQKGFVEDLLSGERFYSSPCWSHTCLISRRLVISCLTSSSVNFRDSHTAAIHDVEGFPTSPLDIRTNTDNISMKQSPTTDSVSISSSSSFFITCVPSSTHILCNTMTHFMMHSTLCWHCGLHHEIFHSVEQYMGRGGCIHELREVQIDPLLCLNNIARTFDVLPHLFLCLR